MALIVQVSYLLLPHYTRVRDNGARIALEACLPLITAAALIGFLGLTCDRALITYPWLVVFPGYSWVSSMMHNHKTSTSAPARMLSFVIEIK